MTGRDRIRGLFELVRPGNAVAAAVLTFTGGFVARGPEVPPGAVGSAVAATVLAVAAGNAVNDYFDRDIDRINDPDRPIPRGAVAPRTALGFSVVLFAFAVAAAVMLPALAVAIAVVNLVALITYTSVFKGLPGAGNAVVSYLVGSTFLFGGAAVGDPESTLVLAALAALATFAREVIKDVEDVAGDCEEGLTTLPIALGERRALWIAAVALAVAIVASPIPFVVGTFGVPYLVLVAPADAVMGYAAYESFSDPTAGQTRLKYGTFLATAAFVGGRAALVVG